MGICGDGGAGFSTRKRKGTYIRTRTGSSPISPGSHAGEVPITRITSRLSASEGERTISICEGVPSFSTTKRATTVPCSHAVRFPRERISGCEEGGVADVAKMRIFAP